jgi:hypothetical protein
MTSSPILILTRPATRHRFELNTASMRYIGALAGPDTEQEAMIAHV